MIDLVPILEAGSDVPTYAIEDLVHSAATLVYGVPYAGKSYLTLSMAHALSTGRSWFGRTVNAPGPVAIWALDPGQARQTRERAESLQGESWENVSAFTNRPPRTEEDWQQFAILLHGHGVRYLVADNLFRMLPLGKTVKDDDAVQAVTWGLDMVAAQGISVVLIHHESTKGGRGPLGSTALEAWARHQVRLGKKDGDRRTLQTQSNDGASVLLEIEMTRRMEEAAAFFRLVGEGQPGSAKTRNRAPETLDENERIAHWLVENCQGITSTAAASRNLAKSNLFKGTAESLRKRIERSVPVTNNDGTWELRRKR